MMTRQQSSLTRERWEAFARGLARVKTPGKAYVAAGYEPDGNAGQLAATKEIDEAVEEITPRSGWGETRDVKPLIEDLKAAFDGAVRLDSAAGMAAARGLAAEAAKLKQLLPSEPDDPQEARARRLNNLTEAEWIKLHGQPAP
jgi:hypothetical protein